MNDHEISQIAHDQIERLYREARSFNLTRGDARGWRHHLARILVRLAERLEPEP